MHPRALEVGHSEVLSGIGYGDSWRQLFAQGRPYWLYLSNAALIMYTSIRWGSRWLQNRALWLVNITANESKQMESCYLSLLLYISQRDGGRVPDPQLGVTSKASTVQTPRVKLI